MNTKRVSIATALGLVFGVLNWFLAAYAAPRPIARSAIATIILGRVVLGFVIGISSWRVSWWIHGLALGFIVGLPAAFAARLMVIPMGTPLTPNVMSALVLGLSLVIGFLIELLTIVVFKARPESANVTPR